MLLVSLIAPNVRDKGTESFERCFGGWRSLPGSVPGREGGKAFVFKGIRAGSLPLLIRLEPCFSLPAAANILMAGGKAIVLCTFITCNPRGTLLITTKPISDLWPPRWSAATGQGGIGYPPRTPGHIPIPPTGDSDGTVALWGKPAPAVVAPQATAMTTSPVHSRGKAEWRF